MAACPCGNMGRGNYVYFFTELEISRYRKKIGGALMDLIDIRIPVEAVELEDLRLKIDDPVERQKQRYKGLGIQRNRSLSGAMTQEFCPLSKDLQEYFTPMARKISFPSRACHSVFKVARTIADLAGHEHINQEDLEETGQNRKYGDSSLFWNEDRSIFLGTSTFLTYKSIIYKDLIYLKSLFF